MQNISLTFACFLAISCITAQAQEGTVEQTLSQESVLTRDSDGQLIVHATRITQPINVDGRLDEPAYSNVPAITEFVQQIPIPGAPITEQTEAWVLFDDTNIYIACRCLDEHPERMVANDMRRDSSSISSQDGFTVSFDTFNDERDGFMFTVTPIGAMRDGTSSEARANFNWNTVWNGAGARSELGYIVEMAIPFKSLRYKPGREQIWGIQLRRNIAGKNEASYLTPLLPQWGRGAIHHFSDDAILLGLEAPETRNLEIKSYAMSTVTTDHRSSPPLQNDVDPDAGIDLKYGLTKSLTADFTYNTDFAQVEVDEAQVNLTRFSLVFPEKREFFLESSAVFEFGSGGTGNVRSVRDVPAVFYSRRIGLSGSKAIPVIAGGRLTGKAGSWSIGALNIETDGNASADVKQTNFTVLRLRRDILRRSTIGGIFTRRSVSTIAPGTNDVFGFDANLGFYQNVYLNGYLAKSRTEGRSGNDLSYRTQFSYTGDRYGLSFNRLAVEKNFNPEVGFLRRKDFRRNYTQARFSPRTTNHPIVRQLTWQGTFDYTTDNENRLESRELTGMFRTDFHNSDSLTLQYSRLHEFLPASFEISKGIQIPVGGYSFDNIRVSFTAGPQRRISGSTAVEVGRFYNGNKKTATFRGRIEVTPQLGIEPNISLNWIELPQDRFTTTVARMRSVFTPTNRMFVAALVQYSSRSKSFSTNLRFRWEYQPGSDFFIVYTEGRTTLSPLSRFRTELENRGVIVKFTRLFRF